MGPLQHQFDYNASTGLLTEVNQGLGVTYGIEAQAGQGMETSAADYGSQDVAVITDALGDATTYQVNQVGIETFQESPLGAIQSWDVNSAGETILYIDENGLSTSYGYDNFGDMTEEVDPDGSTTSYTYDATCHEVTLEIDDPADRRLSTTTNGYDESNGEITASITDPALQRRQPQSTSGRAA